MVDSVIQTVCADVLLAKSTEFIRHGMGGGGGLENSAGMSVYLWPTVRRHERNIKATRSMARLWCSMSSIVRGGCLDGGYTYCSKPSVLYVYIPVPINDSILA